EEIPGTPVSPLAYLGTWLPGMDIVTAPPGTAFRVPAGALALVQVHYHRHSADPPADRTRVELALADAESAATLRPIDTLRLYQGAIDIPAGAPEVVVEQRNTLAGFRGPGGARLVAVGGHMHLVGKSVTLSAVVDGAQRILLDIPDWNFRLQEIYSL